MVSTFPHPAAPFRAPPLLTLTRVRHFPLPATLSGNTYVVLLAKHAAKGIAFGVCSTAQGSDTIDWQFSQAGQNSQAVVSGSAHNNVLLHAYFSDNTKKVVSGSGRCSTALG